MESQFRKGELLGMFLLLHKRKECDVLYFVLKSHMLRYFLLVSFPASTQC